MTKITVEIDIHSHSTLLSTIWLQIHFFIFPRCIEIIKQSKISKTSKWEVSTAILNVYQKYLVDIDKHKFGTYDWLYKNLVP